MAFLLFLVLLASTSICCSKDVEREKVKVQLYYECLNQDDIKFYEFDFWNMANDLGSLVDVETWPFGNANFVDKHQTQVVCKHGEKECYGNKLHACVIDKLKDTLKYMEFNKCLMVHGTASKSDDYAVDICGIILGIDSESIKKCAKSQEGQDLLIQAGKETYKVRPGQKYTPYTLINGKEYPYQTDGNLLRYVCNVLQDPPLICVRAIEHPNVS